MGAMNPDSLVELPLIVTHTREELLGNGSLVNVTGWTETRPGYGLTGPVALTRALWDAIQAIPEDCRDRQDVRGRAVGVLFVAAIAVRRALTRNRYSVSFPVPLPVVGRERRIQTLRAIVEPDGITIGFPEDA